MTAHEKEAKSDAAKPTIEPEQAVAELARELYEAIEYFDPSEGAPSWTSLSDAQRQFYALCVKKVLKRKSLVRLLF